MSTHALTRDTTAAGGFLRTITATGDSGVATFLRLTLAVALMPHGLQKVFGMFGGTTLADSYGWLADTMGLPAIVAATVIAIEFLGPIALALGLFSRVVAAGIVAIMVGAVATVHGANGFMMNWSGQAAGEGFEYHLLATAIASVVLVLGSGRYSLDRRIAARD